MAHVSLCAFTCRKSTHVSLSRYEWTLFLRLTFIMPQGAQVTAVVEDILVSLRLHKPDIEFLFSNQGSLIIIFLNLIVLPQIARLFHATQMYSSSSEDVSTPNAL